jgi:ABC-2 type transport system ATP-binding protein
MSLRVADGEVFGLVGPRGAGKSTLARILAGLIAADAGTVLALGYNLALHGREAQRQIGYLGQRAGIGRGIAGRDYVLLMAALRGLRGRQASLHADALLHALEVGSAAGRHATTLTRSEQRRVLLAGALVGAPRLLILDEPAVGLSAYERALVWRSLHQARRAAGVTIFLATSRLEEGEVLVNRVALIDRGALITTGTPAELKEQAPGSLVVVTLLQRDRLSEAAALLEHLAGVRSVRPQYDRINLEVAGASAVTTLLRVLEEHDIAVHAVTLLRSSLEEVFFRYTGRKMADEREAPAGATNPIGHR